MDKLDKVQKKLDRVEKKFDESTLAMEMLRELKRSGTRKFVIIVILIIALVGTNLAWLIRENSFETVLEEEETQYMEDLDNASNSTFTQTIN